jgi:hypothetical protein
MHFLVAYTSFTLPPCASPLCFNSPLILFWLALTIQLYPLLLMLSYLKPEKQQNP